MSTDGEAVTTTGTAIGGEQWCDRCGESVGAGAHPGCRAARALEPPRYCPWCRRRMRVQVLPVGWRATCVEHGVTTA